MREYVLLNGAFFKSFDKIYKKRKNKDSLLFQPSKEQ